MTRHAHALETGRERIAEGIIDRDTSLTIRGHEHSLPTPGPAECANRALNSGVAHPGLVAVVRGRYRAFLGAECLGRVVAHLVECFRIQSAHRGQWIGEVRDDGGIDSDRRIVRREVIERIRSQVTRRRVTDTVDRHQLRALLGPRAEGSISKA